MKAALVRHWRTNSLNKEFEIHGAYRHGSGYSTSPSFPSAPDPEFILCSTGGDGHEQVELEPSTAKQLATTWGNDYHAFTNGRRKRVGEIAIFDAQEGENYSINGERHLAFDDQAEHAAADVGEEERSQPRP